MIILCDLGIFTAKQKKLLAGTNLPQQERQLALTATNKLEHSGMKSALKRIFGEKFTSNASSFVVKVKEEPVYLTSRSDREWTYKPVKGSRKPKPKGTNPLMRDGTMSRCAICESNFHWLKDCPHRDESVNSKYIFVI